MTTQKVCSIACAKAMAKDPKLQKVAAKGITKQARQDLQERREKLKTRREHMAEAQTAFNAHVRERDAGLHASAATRCRAITTSSQGAAGTLVITGQWALAQSCASDRSTSTASA